MIMKKAISLIFTLFICVTLFSQELENRGYIINVGDVAPNFTIVFDDGTEKQLTDLQDKIVMLQFTASWCGVCRKEMPFIEKEIWQVHKEKDFIVIGIDRDEPIEKVLKFKKQTGITYPLALDPDANIFALFAKKEAGVTRNVIIDKTGKIVYLTRLFNREEFDEMKEKIEELLKM
jgi:peroxiredoxin